MRQSVFCCFKRSKTINLSEEPRPNGQNKFITQEINFSEKKITPSQLKKAARDIKIHNSNLNKYNSDCNFVEYFHDTQKPMIFIFQRDDLTYKVSFKGCFCDKTYYVTISKDQKLISLKSITPSFTKAVAIEIYDQENKQKPFHIIPFDDKSKHTSFYYYAKDGQSDNQNFELKIKDFLNTHKINIFQEIKIDSQSL